MSCVVVTVPLRFSTSAWSDLFLVFGDKRCRPRASRLGGGRAGGVVSLNWARMGGVFYYVAVWIRESVRLRQ